ncbi:hypothetical protein CR513_42525, partial [Mucuna pruriens]
MDSQFWRQKHCIVAEPGEHRGNFVGAISLLLADDKQVRLHNFAQRILRPQTWGVVDFQL